MAKMLVMKFGGSSLATPERMKIVAGLVLAAHSDSPVLVVLSAIKGSTDSLVKLSEFLLRKQLSEGAGVLSDMETKYHLYSDQLFSSSEFKEKGRKCLKCFFDFLRGLSSKPFGVPERLVVVAQGELMSTHLFQLYLAENKAHSALLPALEFMRVDRAGEPDAFYIKKSLNRELEKFPEVSLFVTQGFICRDYFGEVANLSRNSSDYSATLIGKAVDASRIELWTDIDGFHNNDPRIVKDITRPIQQMSYDEAIELGYFGAKIVFPDCVVPAQELNIPVLLKSTLDPEKEGTIITANTTDTQGVKAISAKDNIIVIHVRSSRLLALHSFLQKVFEIFDKHHTPVDMVSSAEVAISLTLADMDNPHIPNIIDELQADRKSVV